MAFKKHLLIVRTRTLYRLALALTLLQLLLHLPLLNRCPFALSTPHHRTGNGTNSAVRKHEFRRLARNGGGKIDFDRKGFRLRMKEEDGIVGRGSAGNDVSGVAQVERPMGGAPRKDDFGAGAGVEVEVGVGFGGGVTIVNNNEDDRQIVGGRIVSNTAPSDDINTNTNTPTQTKTVKEGVTLLLFYQYIEPILSEVIYQTLIAYVTAAGTEHSITGRMRIAREGLNCTLTGTYTSIRSFCRSLRNFHHHPNEHPFSSTEFKLTDSLPPTTAFPRIQ